jgi:branched-chain amino acid transport system substrate-binding protein
MNRQTKASSRSFAVGVRSLLAATCAVLGTLSCADAADDSHANTVALGLLLPYSGNDTGMAVNFEWAAILAVERVNAAGGIRGKPLRLVGADTHSRVDRGKQSAKCLIEEGAVAVLGMESSDIAQEVEPTFFEHDVALISPVVGSADDTSVGCTSRWFRLAPSAKTMAEALAKQMIASHVPAIAVLSTPDAYSKAFGNSLAKRFKSLGGSVSLQAELDPTAASYGELLEQVTGAGVSDIVLSAPPTTAAWVASEAYLTFRAKVNWYLSPLLKTDLLIQNAAPGALDGARGVAPKLFETEDGFAQAFKERAHDIPLEGAYFYFDAVVLAAYALQLASSTDEGAISAEAFKNALLTIARPVGITTTWTELDKGLDGIAAKQSVYYTGLTGPMQFDACGARRIGAFSNWSIRAGRIISETGT